MVRKNNNREIIKKEEEFTQRIVDVARVTRVMAGGKRMKFRVCLAIGDKKGRIGIGIAKGKDVTLGITKALARAKKDLVKINFVNETIAHQVNIKFKAAKVLLKPAKKGTGIKAGGPMRILCELVGIPNVTGKILGSNNKINIAKATMEAFKSLRSPKKSKEDKADIASDKSDKSVKVEPSSSAKASPSANASEDKSDDKKKETKVQPKENLKDKLKKIIKKIEKK